MGISSRLPMRTFLRLAEFVPLSMKLFGVNVPHECRAIIAAWALNYFWRLGALEPHLPHIA
jgi:hypothetical protein